MWTMIYHIERGRTRQEFIVPFEAKPRWYREFKTCSNPSKCGYHCPHSFRWAYCCPSLNTMQQRTISLTLTVGQQIFVQYIRIQRCVLICTSILWALGKINLTREFFSFDDRKVILEITNSYVLQIWREREIVIEQSLF